MTRQKWWDKAWARNKQNDPRSKAFNQTAEITRVALLALEHQMKFSDLFTQKPKLTRWEKLQRYMRGIWEALRNRAYDA